MWSSQKFMASRRMGRRNAVGTTILLISPTSTTPTACLTLKSISIHSSSVCVIIWTVTKLATQTESVLSGPFFLRWVLLCAIWTRWGLRTWRLLYSVSMSILLMTFRTNNSRATRCAARCCIGSSPLRVIYLDAVCCVSGKVKPPTSDRSGTNFRESVGWLTCQVDPIR